MKPLDIRMEWNVINGFNGMYSIEYSMEDTLDNMLSYTFSMKSPSFSIGYEYPFS